MFPFTERARFTRLQRMLRQVGLTLHHCPEDSQRFAELGRYYVTEDGSVCAKDVNLGVWIKEGKTPDQLTFLCAVSSLEGDLFERGSKPGTWRMRPQLQQEAAAHQIIRQAAGPWGSRR
jgi:hypothetical protein